MRIILDLDGCLADFDSLACEKFGPCDRKIYSLEERWPDRAGEVRKFVANPLTYALLQPISGAVNNVSRLAAVHEIFYVTARPGGCVTEEITRLWLDWHGFPPREVYVVDYKVKAELIRSLLADTKGFAVDDAPYQIEAMRKLGISTVIFDQPWNRALSGMRYLEGSLIDWPLHVCLLS